MKRTIRFLHVMRAAATLILMLLTIATAWAQTPATIGGIEYNSDGGYYVIDEPDDLRDLATYVNGTGTYRDNSTETTAHNCSGLKFKMTDDITFTATTTWNDDTSTENNYEAIGGFYNDDNRYFRGDFDGAGHTISGIRINRSGDAKADRYQGIFGRTEDGANIHSLRLADARITGYGQTGGIVGYNYRGTVTDCHVANNVCIHAVQTNAYYHGGIAGYNSNGTVENCTSAATLTIPSNATDCQYYGAIAGSNMAGTLRDNLAIGATVPAATYNYHGAIAGSITGNGTLQRNYYTACTVAGVANATNVGCSNADVTTNDGAVPAVLTQNGNTYTISNTGGWDVFCYLLADNDKGYFTGKTVKLANNITVTWMAGGSYHDFTGTFDGQGHTLTVSYGSADSPIAENNAAPFRNVESGCVIENLHVSGDIYTSQKFAAGLAGTQYGAVTIRNCHVSTVIHSFTSGDGTHGGIVGSNGNGSGSSVTIEGCLFDGKLLTEGETATTNCSGFVGYRSNNRTVAITNSLYAPAALADGETEVQDGTGTISATFVRNGAAGTNCYYTRALGTAQGKQARTVTAGDNVTIEAIALTGETTEYNVSGITAYSGGGLQLGQTLYYGSDDQLSLTLSNTATGAPQGYQYGYTASAGTLSGSTLTMPDQDVTISVNTADLAPIDWATVNEGDSEDDPYMIYNKDQLLLLAHRVNGTNGETANTYQGKFFKLGADITFTHPADEGDDYAENYEAIGGRVGSTYRYFKGEFDGANHTVSGIRIRKTDSGTADINQGLFGCIASGANIYDVHLTDARITGYYSVGGIAGYNNEGYISGCSVTDSYITALSLLYGTICGENLGTLTNNYYHGCTVNGTAVTSGVGHYGSDITDNNGALPAYRLDLGANITTPPGTFVGQTGWLDTPPVSPRLDPGNGFTLAGNHYFASGYVFTPGSTLASGAAQGYTPRATLGDELLDLYTPTGNADPLAGNAIARLTITANCDGKTLASTEAIYSTGQPVTVAYIKADGTPGEASAIALDGTETSLAAGWYFVGKDISYTHTVNLTGNVNLILCDGCDMNVGESGAPIEVAYFAAIDGYVNNGEEVLTIYGQTLGTGTLKAYASGDGYIAIKADALTVNGGNITAGADGEYPTAIYTQGDININRGTVTATATSTATGTESYGIYAYNGTVNINGGTVTANGTENSIYGNAVNINGGTITANGGGIYIDCENGDVTINGGNVTASSIYSESGNIILGWTRPADRITASSISTGGGGTVAVADGQALTDGSGHIYTGTLTASELSGFAAETTLQPCLALADAADNNAAITDHAGQTLAVALAGRTLYKDGSWNTLCLPFDVTLSGSVLDGDGVEAMTLGSSTYSGGTLTLDFTDAGAMTTLEAGTPYIVRWAKPDGYDDNPSAYDLVSPVFTGVTASTATANVETDYVDFIGTYSPTVIYEDDAEKHNLYLGSANKLYYPTVEGFKLNACRGYFKLKGLSVGSAASARSIVLNFGSETTGIENVNVNGNDNGVWTTVGGVRLDGKPTRSGLYIHNGRKVVIK